MKKLAVLLALTTFVFGCKRGEHPQPSTSTQPARPAATATSSASAPETGTDVGSTMPEYSALGLDGSKFELNSKRDKVVLLNLWATWCGPCRYEIPELQALHTKYTGRGLEVIGVSVDESGIESVRQFVNEHKMTYPVVLDPEGKLATIFQTSVLPTSVVIDRAGKIVWKHYGAIEPNDAELLKAIEKSL